MATLTEQLNIAAELRDVPRFAEYVSVDPNSTRGQFADAVAGACVVASLPLCSIADHDFDSAVEAVSTFGASDTFYIWFM